MITLNDLLVKLLERVTDEETLSVMSEEPGICSLIDNLCYNLTGHYRIKFGESTNHASNLIKTYYDEWEHFSGSFAFPVLVPEQEGDPEYQYTDLDYSHWTGKQLEMRISLLNHLIECTK